MVTTPVDIQPARKATGKLRWIVVGLVALATVINYIDRQTITVLWPQHMAPDLFPDMNADGHKQIFGLVSAVFILGSALALTAIGAIWFLCGTIEPPSSKTLSK